MKKTILLILFLLLILSLSLYVKSLRKTSEVPAQTLTITYQCQSGKTPYQVLEQTQSSVESQDSSFGKMVTSINGTSQSSGKYWLYDIDGKEATIAASMYICRSQEQIRWQLK